MSQQLPKWLKGHCREAIFKDVEQVIQQIELKTDGEVVPVIVRESISSIWISRIISLFLISIFYILDLHLHLLSWFPGLHLSEELAKLSLFIFAFLIGKLLSLNGRWTYKAYHYFSHKNSVFERAELEFYKAHVHKTRLKTGILVFISMYERRVVILADEKINKLCPEGTWQKIVDELVIKLSQKDLYGGLLSALHKCGDILIDKVPASKDNPNELKNSLIIRN